MSALGSVFSKSLVFFLALALLSFSPACSDDPEPSSSNATDAGDSSDTGNQDVERRDTTAADIAARDVDETDGSDAGPSPVCPLMENECLVQEDCTEQGAFCAPAGTTSGCGACQNLPDLCADDSECKSQGDHFICEPAECACGPDGSGQSCVAGCQADDACPEGQSCTSGRCGPTACTIDSECPPNFGCSDQECTRLACTDSTACDGCCVGGRCYAEPGTCLIPTP